MLAKLIAVAIREVREELRKLDEPQSVRQDPEPVPPPAPEPAQPDESRHRYDPASTTAACTERAPSWDHDTRKPVTASRFGFGPGR
jgi:hypothetical protein